MNYEELRNFRWLNVFELMEQQILALDSRYSAYRAPKVPGFSELIWMKVLLLSFIIQNYALRNFVHKKTLAAPQKL